MYNLYSISFERKFLRFLKKKYFSYFLLPICTSDLLFANTLFCSINILQHFLETETPIEQPFTLHRVRLSLKRLLESVPHMAIMTDSCTELSSGTRSGVYTSTRTRKWVVLGERPGPRIRIDPLTEKVMIYGWCDCEGFIYWESIPINQTVNSTFVLPQINPSN